MVMKQAIEYNLAGGAKNEPNMIVRFKLQGDGKLPRGQVCATPKAVLGFHAAWRPTPNGGRVTSPLATQVMYGVYPANVRKWIARHGGLSERLILLKGRELAAMVPACDAGPAIRPHPTMRTIRS